LQVFFVCATIRSFASSQIVLASIVFSHFFLAPQNFPQKSRDQKKKNASINTIAAEQHSMAAVEQQQNHACIGYHESEQA
jgi:hypothetical protein